jgi:hypothetical protein
MNIYEDFEFELYKILYNDIPKTFNKKQCYEHYYTYGINENRYNPNTIINDLSINSNKIIKMFNDNNRLIFTHMGGGGTEEYLKNIYDYDTNLIIRPIVNKSKYLFITNDNKYINNVYDNNLISIIKNNNISCLLITYDELNNLLKNFKGNIFINHLFHYDMENIIKIIKEVKLNNKNIISIMLHDYFYINKLPQPIEKDFDKTLNLKNSYILKLADTITCPSYWVQYKYNFYIPEIKINVKYHINYDKIIVNSILPTYNNFKVMIYGEINTIKGEDIIVNLINKSKCLNYVIYGRHLLDKLIYNKKNVCLYGEYNNKDISSIIKKENPAIILFTSVFAETFCYALSHAIYSGYPIICPNMGSFIELSKYINNVLLIDPYELNEYIIMKYILHLTFNSQS